MTVIGAGLLLFCEGDANSLDRLLLNRLLEDKPPHVTIVPGGGKHQLRAFARGRLAAENSSVAYLVFRDRDLDEQPPIEVSLIRPPGEAPV